MMNEAKFKRVLLKLSGEALSGQDGRGINAEVLENIVDEVAQVVAMGVEVAIVVGGGNIWRGLGGTKKGISRTTGDSMGMLATVINSLAISDALNAEGVKARVMTAINMEPVAEFYAAPKARRELEKGEVVVFGGGIGNPYFSTDTTAALRAAEIEADVILMAKNIDGVYDSDPRVNPNAKRFATITYGEILSKGLKVMDATAASLCRDNDIAIFVFDMLTKGNIKRAVMGENIGTYIRSEKND